MLPASVWGEGREAGMIADERVLALTTESESKSAVRLCRRRQAAVA
jgi:hypothetical protein